MATEHFFQLRMRSAKDTVAFGELCGEVYLSPLLSSGNSSFETLLVSLYGLQNMGKSTLVKGCINGLGIQPRWTPAGSFGQMGEVGDRVFRHADLGPYVFRDMDLDDLGKREDLSSGGIDFIEHCPLSRLNFSGLVVSIHQSRSTQNYEPHVIMRLEDVKSDLTPKQLLGRRALRGVFRQTEREANERVSLPSCLERSHVVTVATLGRDPIEPEKFDALEACARSKFSTVPHF